jgi:hypothetical protein
MIHICNWLRLKHLYWRHTKFIHTQLSGRGIVIYISRKRFKTEELLCVKITLNHLVEMPRKDASFYFLK